MKRMPYVKKPIFGREGDTVELYDGKGSKTLEETQKSYEAYGFVYQQYVDLPVLQIDVNGQKQDGHMMYGSFFAKWTRKQHWLPRWGKRSQIM
ncbi:hypothetical protein GCM10020331_042960 [Ectobacillus funiculus]